MQVASVKVVYNASGLLTSLSVSGHAGVAKVGSGLEVCIALSVLSQSLVFALCEFTNKDCYRYKADSGDFSFISDLSALSEKEKSDYSLITKSYLVNIKKLSREYQEYIKYTEE